MKEQKAIDIKVKVDKSDVDKSFKDIEKSADQMANKVKASNKGLEQSFNGVKRQAQDVNSQMRNAFRGINISGLTNTMNKVKQTVAQTMQKVKSQIQSSLSAFNGKMKMPTDTTKLPTSNPNDNSIPKQLSLIDKMKKKLKEWQKQHQETAKQIKNANKGISSSFKSLLSAMMPFLSIYAIFNGLKTAINDAMESIETDNMFDTVFGSSSQEMNQWVSEVNKTLGLGITNTKKYTATISQMGRAMGLTGTQAMEMSQKMALMAGDISSFYDTDIANVQADLRSALSGSFETMDKYGIVLRTTTIQQFAYANGIAQTGAELTNAQRAMATTMMIEQQLGLANGDLARSINSPANQARILRSNLADLSVALGKCFMPIITVVLPILNTFVAALTTTINAIANFIAQVFALFGVNVDFGGVGGAVDDMASSIESADTGSGGLSDNLASGAESAKEIQKFLGGIDELNIVTSKQDSGSSGSGGSGSSGTGGGVGTGGIDTGAIDSGLAQAETKFSQWAQKVASALQSVWGALSNGWNSVSGYIDSSLNNLKQSFANLGQSIENFLIGCWNNGGEELIYNIGRLAGAFTGLALDISGQVVNAVSKLFDHLNPDNNPNTRKFINAMNNALVACQNFALSAGGWLEKFMSSGGQAFINNIGDIAVIVGTILVEALGRGIKLVTDFMNSWVGQALIEGCAKALEWLSSVLEAMLGWVQENQVWIESLGLAILGAYGAFKLINGAITLFNGVMTICSGVMTILSGAGTVLAGVIAFITSPIGLVVLVIGALIAIGYLLWDNWDWLCEKAGELKEWIAKKWTEVKDAVVKKVKEMVDGVKQWWSDLKTNTVNKFNEIKTNIVNKWTEIKTSVVNKVVEIKNNIVNKWNEIKTNVVNKVTEIKDGIKNKFNEAYTSVTSIFTNIKTKITDTINGARDNVGKAIEKIKGFFNFSWSLPKIKLPHFKMSGEFSLMPPKVPSFSVEWYRNGGILPAGSNAIFGMNGGSLMRGGEISTGGEAILPLSDLFSEMRGMFDTQNRQLISALSNNNQPINLSLNIDGTTLAKKQFKSFKELSRLGIIDMSELV